MPGWPDAWMRVGMCLHHLRRYQEASGAMRHGLDVDRWEQPSFMLVYMDTLRELGRLREVVEVARRMQEGPLIHFALLFAGGAMQAFAGKDEAKHFFERAV